MKRQEAGFLLLLAAGITMLIGAFVPWAQLEHPPATFDALRMQMYGPFTVAIVTGLLIVGFALARTMWAALVGLGATFVAMLLILTLHADVYSGINVAVPGITYDSASHLTGFGVAVFFAAALLAGAGAMITVVQTSPKVVTSPTKHSD